MNGKFLLDTNIVIALFSGDASVSEKIALTSEIYLPAIVIGELYYGAYNSSKKQANIERIEAFKLEIPILDCDEYTANYYGQIKSELKRKGMPIPENDIWIAAMAMQYDLVLTTRDAHFSNIETIAVSQW